MVFSQPLVPSPTLSSSAKTPPLGSSSSSSSTPQQQQPASPATSKASYSTATAQPATVGLGVLGAPGPDEEELADASKAQVTSPLELTQFVSRAFIRWNSRNEQAHLRGTRARTGRHAPE
jgi:hypothetical protein